MARGEEAHLPGKGEHPPCGLRPIVDRLRGKASRQMPFSVRRPYRRRVPMLVPRARGPLR
jgi:hypothetical protein